MKIYKKVAFSFPLKSKYNLLQHILFSFYVVFLILNICFPFINHPTIFTNDIITNFQHDYYIIIIISNVNFSLHGYYKELQSLEKNV